jgi:broad specificity phosphatase PhoE
MMLAEQNAREILRIAPPLAPALEPGPHDRREEPAAPVRVHVDAVERLAMLAVDEEHVAAITHGGTIHALRRVGNACGCRWPAPILAGASRAVREQDSPGILRAGGQPERC